MPRRSCVLPVVSAVLAAACAQRPAASSDTLTLAVHADVTGIFPNAPIQNDTFTTFINRNVFEGLVAFDRNLGIEPGLAVRWESPDDRTTICHLRPDARFSSGEPMRAADVVASLRAPRERGSDLARLPPGHRIGGSAGQDAHPRADAGAVSRRPHAPAVGVRAARAGACVLARAPDRDGPLRGGGVDAREAPPAPPQRAPLGRRPDFGQVRFHVVLESLQRVERLRRGQADVIDHVPFEMAPDLQADPKVSVIVRPSLLVLFLGFRVDQPPFSDPRVREAVDLAIDREAVIRRALGGHGDPASQVVPRSDRRLRPIDRGAHAGPRARSGPAGRPGARGRAPGPAGRPQQSVCERL